MARSSMHALALTPPTRARTLRTCPESRPCNAERSWPWEQSSRQTQFSSLRECGAYVRSCRLMCHPRRARGRTEWWVGRLLDGARELVTARPTVSVEVHLGGARNV